MRIIAHISDLHFGKVDNILADKLKEDLNSIKPNLLVISGDLTQRARTNQYIQAKEYLEKLPKPQLVIPGNHDIPLFDLFSRFFFPLTRYKKYITENLAPLFRDEEIAVYGINTARSLTWKSGRISIDQINDMQQKLCPVPKDIFKVVVTHHPFIPPPEDQGIKLVGRSVRALKIIDKCYIDLLLAGHLHNGYTGDVRTFYPKRERSVIVAQAGTAISNRVREEPNAYNLIKVESRRMEITERWWNGKEFQNKNTTIYTKSGDLLWQSS